MAKNFKNLEDQMSPERLARAKSKAKGIMAEMFLSEIRKEMGLTQEGLAQKLGIKQPSLSKLEGQSDIQLSTLSRIIQALGGQLEIVAHLPGGEIKIRQFQEP
ncbi:MAG: helix-turn-helix transcriptional regulator [Planctomycetes bacterium]|nr:helix-turn-helix transcriptional regulator [Planctomycetota bacterium]